MGAYYRALWRHLRRTTRRWRRTVRHIKELIQEIGVYRSSCQSIYTTRGHGMSRWGETSLRLRQRRSIPCSGKQMWLRNEV